MRQKWAAAMPIGSVDTRLRRARESSQQSVKKTACVAIGREAHRLLHDKANQFNIMLTGTNVEQSSELGDASKSDLVRAA